MTAKLAESLCAPKIEKSREDGGMCENTLGDIEILDIGLAEVARNTVFVDVDEENAAAFKAVGFILAALRISGAGHWRQREENMIE